VIGLAEQGDAIRRFRGMEVGPVVGFPRDLEPEGPDRRPWRGGMFLHPQGPRGPVAAPHRFFVECLHFWSRGLPRSPPPAGKTGPYKNRRQTQAGGITGVVRED